MSNSSPERNKAIVLEAFETLFNKRDYAAAERFWSPNYIQHSAHIPPGREGLFNLVRSVPDTLHYENQLTIAEGDYVIAHGRFTGMGRPAAWIAADVIRFEDGLLREHWDVLQDEAAKGRIRERPSHVRRHIPKVRAEDYASPLSHSAPFLPDQGGSDHDFIRYFE